MCSAEILQKIRVLNARHNGMYVQEARERKREKRIWETLEWAQRDTYDDKIQENEKSNRETG
jgi:hypothetical protein